MQGSGLQDPRGLLCLSEQFRALCSPYSFSYKGAGALLSVLPGRFLLQLLLSVAEALLRLHCWAGSATVLRFFGHNSSSRSGAWAIGLFLPDELVGGFVVEFQGLRSSLIVVFSGQDVFKSTKQDSVK